MKGIHSTLAQAGFTRSTQDRVLGGVCGGLAAKLGVSAWAMRALVVVTMLLLPGSQLLLYPIAWILMPDDTYVALPSGYPGPQDRLHH